MAGCGCGRAKPGMITTEERKAKRLEAHQRLLERKAAIQAARDARRRTSS